VRGVRSAAAVAVGAVALAFGTSACGDASRTAQGAFEPATDGRLVVATELPAPGFWEGDDAATLEGGFEWALARELGARLDLSVRFVEVPVEDVVVGDLHGADLALAQIAVTAEREEDLAFSVPYLDGAPAVLTLAEGGAAEAIVDLATAREQVWAVPRGSAEATYLDDVVRPDEDVVAVADAARAADAVLARRVDAALVELPAALVLAGDHPDLTVDARFDAVSPVAVAMPVDSPIGNVVAVDRALNAMRADGTLDDLTERWLDPVFSVAPADVPVIRTR
jgi:polar amino acid transport system substrate-binding protein